MTLILKSGKSYAKRVVLSASAAISAFRKHFSPGPVDRRWFTDPRAKSFPVGIYPTKLDFCINFATEISCSRARMVLPSGLTSLTAEALRK